MDSNDLAVSKNKIILFLLEHMIQRNMDSNRIFPQSADFIAILGKKSDSGYEEQWNRKSR